MHAFPVSPKEYYMRCIFALFVKRIKLLFHSMNDHTGYFYHPPKKFQKEKEPLE